MASSDNDPIIRGLRNAGRSHDPDPAWQRRVWDRIEQRRPGRLSRFWRALIEGRYDAFVIAFVVGAIFGILAGAAFAIWGMR